MVVSMEPEGTQLSCKITRNTSTTTTAKEISEQLKAQHDMELDSKKLVLAEPIKTFGSFEVKAKLGFEITGTVYVLVCEEK